MKKTITLLSLSMVILLSARAAELKINITPQKSIKNAEFVVCLKSLSFYSDYQTAYDTMYISKTGNIDIPNLEVGKYTISVQHPSSEVLFYNVYIPKKETVVEMDVKLGKLTIPEQIDSVWIIGNFNHWDFNSGYLPMEYNTKDKDWEIHLEKNNKLSDGFYFVLNRGHKVIDPELPIAPKDSPWPDFHNNLPEKQKTIIFDPSKYVVGDPGHKVTITGNNPEFQALCDTVRIYLSDFNTQINNAYSDGDLENFTMFYKKIGEKLDFYADKYKNDFSWLFPELYLRYYQYAPIIIERSIVSRDKGSEAARQISSSEEYLSLLSKRAKLFQSLKMNELMLSPQLIKSMYSFSQYEMPNYDLYEELGIPYGYFMQFLSDILKKTNNNEICGAYLEAKASDIKYYIPAKSKKILQQIKEQYPKYSGVKNGNIDRQLKEYSIVQGTMAPDFELERTDGEKISLASFKGKYVYLDFWGTWCGPCRGETPNIKKLRTDIPEDKLAILGVASRDTKEKVLAYIKENEINYLNAMATDKILADYGIRAFPTTFLIDPEGKIVAKGLRGSNLSEQVKSAME